MGKPAARVGDMHICPMVTGLVPHVGGPISGPGVSSILLGGKPAAVLGDMCVCTGPPDTIILGSTGILLGGKPAARLGDQCGHSGKIVQGLPTVLFGEKGGAASMAKLSVEVLIAALSSMPKALQPKLKQIIAMKQAAKNGVPFCEKCAEAILKKK